MTLRLAPLRADGHRMDARTHEDSDALAERTTHLIAHLDGALDQEMLTAMSGMWAMLEQAAANGPAHARAVRSRLFWETLRPGDVARRHGNVRDLSSAWTHGAPEADSFGLRAA